MSRKPYFSDEQRITLSKELRSALQLPPVAQDETAQEIAQQLQESTLAIESWQEQEQQRSRMQEADAHLDTCFLGLEAALAVVQHKAFVTDDLATWEQAQEIRASLFPQGLSAIIHIPYLAEAAEALSFLHRCEQPKIADFLQKHRLTDWIIFLQDARNAYLQTIHENKNNLAERAQLSEQTQAARKNFDKTVTRLGRYLRTKYPQGHQQAAWRIEHIEAPLERARAASLAARKARPTTPPTT